MGRHARLLGIVCAIALAGCPAGALADSIASENWSGYVAHGGGATFRSVRATWTQPAGVCPGLYPTWSAIWVGLGGYTVGATALEQLGTEIYCSPSGQARVSAWYELLPALPQTIPIGVRPGDRISAGVIVSGDRVTLRLADRTRRQTFSETVWTNSIDVSSADWIVEAPTVCDSYGNCVVTPMADFGSVRLSRALAQTTAGTWGSIASPLWGRTKISLLPDPYYYSLDNSAALSTPSRLHRGGASFKVAYSRIIARGSTRFTIRHGRRQGDQRR